MDDHGVAQFWSGQQKQSTNNRQFGKSPTKCFRGDSIANSWHDCAEYGGTEDLELYLCNYQFLLVTQDWTCNGGDGDDEQPPIVYKHAACIEANNQFWEEHNRIIHKQKEAAKHCAKNKSRRKKKPSRMKLLHAKVGWQPCRDLLMKRISHQWPLRESRILIIKHYSKDFRITTMIIELFRTYKLKLISN